MSSETDHIVHFLEKEIEGGSHGGIAISLAKRALFAITEGSIADEADDRFDQELDHMHTVRTGTLLGLRMAAYVSCAAIPEGHDNLMLVR